jgi:predicted DNA-binding protein
MIKSDKKLKELEALLEKGDSETIAAAILSLRDEQPYEGVISLLARHYNKSKDIHIRKIIEQFMNDLKDPSACQEVAGEIRRKWDDDTMSMLISSCWQSGLNYSDYTLDIARAYMQCDYVTAIECLTVIETSIDDLGRDKKKEIISLLQSGNFKAAAEKRELTLELISILNR